MKVRVGLSYDLRLPDPEADRADHYQAALEQAEWADRLGLAGISVLEHHGTDGGYLPSPAVFAAAVAARTKRIPISMMLIAPFHDPLRTAEDLAVLDNIARGRLTVIVAGGGSPLEFAMFGRELRERGAAVTEMIEVLKQAWTGEPFEYRGRTVRVTPRPYRKPRPRVMLGGSSTGAARRAARIADGYMAGNPSFEEYRKALLELGKPAPPPLGNAGGARATHVAHDPEAAWAEAGPYFLQDFQGYARTRGEDGAAALTLADARASGEYAIITPEEFVRLGGERGAVPLSPLCGGMPPELAWRSLRLIETEVLPRL